MPVQISPPDPPYIEANSYGPRENHPLKWIIIHSTVSPCEPGGARNIARYFAAPGTEASAHYIIDPEEIIQSVYDSWVAWHCGYNWNSIAEEMCDIPGPVPNDPPGSARRKMLRRSWRWIKPNQRKMLHLTAKNSARIALAYDIPMIWVGVRGLRAGKRGFSSHANMSKAFKKSVHWDPGWWPRRRFMRLVRKYAAEIVAEAEAEARKKRRG